MTPVAPIVDVVAPVDQEGTTAAVKTWLKRVGDRVERDEPLLELETDKVAMEVAAPATGTLREILVEEGHDAARGAVLGRIAAVEHAAQPAAAAVRPPVGASAAPTPAGTRSIAAFDPALRLSPSVRRMLLDTGVDPATVAGTGRGGRVTRADVERAAASAAGRVAPPSSSPRQGGPPSSLGVAQPTVALGAPAKPHGRHVPHTVMRRRIAEHMVHALTTAPHVTALFEADFGAVLAHRRAAKAEFEARGVPLTLTAYLVVAAAAAMKAVPVVNSRWHDDFVEVFADVNIGVGTALADGGLVVPVVHRAPTLSLAEVAARLHQVATGAAAGTLTPADVQHGTFTISNHGVSGSLTAAPIVIAHGQAAILGVGKVEKRVVVREVAGSDAMVIRPMSYVTLSIDHRVVDGAETNAWLTRFVQTLEAWPPAGD